MTNRFFQRLSTALASASSQHALSIILNTFSLRIMDSTCCDEACSGKNTEAVFVLRMRGLTSPDQC